MRKMMCSQPGCFFTCQTFAEKVAHLKEHGIEKWEEFAWRLAPAADAAQTEYVYGIPPDEVAELDKAADEAELPLRQAAQTKPGLGRCTYNQTGHGLRLHTRTPYCKNWIAAQPPERTGRLTAEQFYPIWLRKWLEVHPAILPAEYRLCAFAEAFRDASEAQEEGIFSEHRKAAEDRADAAEDELAAVRKEHQQLLAKLKHWQLEKPYEREALQQIIAEAELRQREP